MNFIRRSFQGSKATSMTSRERMLIPFRSSLLQNNSIFRVNKSPSHLYAVENLNYYIFLNYIFQDVPKNPNKREIFQATLILAGTYSSDPIIRNEINSKEIESIWKWFLRVISDVFASLYNELFLRSAFIYVFMSIFQFHISELFQFISIKCAWTLHIS